MKKLTFILILLIIMGYTANKVFAQENRRPPIKTDSIGYLKVTGIVEEKNKPLENANITLFENDKKVEVIKTKVDGIFMLKLKFNNYYKMEVSKPGLVLKKFEFDTNLPAKVGTHVIYTFDLSEILLFPAYKDMDMSILKKPLAIIRWDAHYDNFYYDYPYAKVINDQVLELQNKINKLNKQNKN